MTKWAIVKWIVEMLGKLFVRKIDINDEVTIKHEPAETYSRETKEDVPELQCWNFDKAVISAEGFNCGLLAQGGSITQTISKERNDVTCVVYRLIGPVAIMDSLFPHLAAVRRPVNLTLTIHDAEGHEADFPINRAVVTEHSGEITAEDMILVEKVKIIGSGDKPFSDIVKNTLKRV